ncbi:protein Abitram [Euwallacea similis]|uniref:protein Abitram n=1 Tax=Euwallacea similis TaxID=1736056 RepID=UPI00344B8437
METPETIINTEIEKLSIPILESISSEEIQKFHPYHQRYFTNWYCTTYNTESENHDIIFRIHTNKLILISIAKGHDIIRQKKIIEKVDFSVNGKDMSDISISGKKKAGAKKLAKDSVLCYIKCKDDDKKYPVNTCISASLIEVNHLINKNPQLLVTDYQKLGYIAVLNPERFRSNANFIDKLISNLKLLSEDEYESYLKSKGA